VCLLVEALAISTRSFYATLDAVRVQPSELVDAVAARLTIRGVQQLLLHHLSLPATS
jgi:hypothetical protein